MLKTKDDKTIVKASQKANISENDFTSDWPKNQLKEAIQKGIDSGNAGISSIEDFHKYFGRK